MASLYLKPAWSEPMAMVYLGADMVGKGKGCYCPRMARKDTEKIAGGKVAGEGEVLRFMS